MEKLKRISVYLWAVVLIVIDQLIKLLVINNIKDDSITIIKGFLKFWYCENEGVAFSIGDGHVPVFIVVNLIIIVGLIIYYEKNKGMYNLLSKMFFTMVIAGGTSNLLDRIVRGYVVDFIDVNEFIDFAVFNVADIFIVCGIIGMITCLIINEFKSVKKESLKNHN
ncbi:MAG: signal peptidase II [Clostridia bacterium]|nr:signal peptidase II [Clostridia bacterium]MBR4260570.1 signal peptidase II [Clostridia bacterium]